MTGLTVVIPSCNLVNLSACVEAVQRHELSCNIVVASDGLDWTSTAAVQCPNTFIFSRNCNLAINAAPSTNDVVLLNDDALLKTLGGFTAMQKLLQEHREYGILSPVTNVVGNLNQLLKPGNEIRNEPRMLAFLCVLIPRATLNLVGLLDERFVAYGFEDDDYCLRIRNAGLKLGVWDGCFVDHGSLKSAFRGHGKPVDLATNQKLFQEKWGTQC